MQPKKLSTPEFSKPKDPDFEKLLKILTPSSSEVPGIKPDQSEETSKSLLGEMPEDQIKIDIICTSEHVLIRNLAAILQICLSESCSKLMRQVK